MNRSEIERRLRASTSGGWTGSLHSELTGIIIGAAIAVHRELGPGKLESVYERALAIELRALGVPFCTQVAIPMLYRGESVGDFFADLIVDRKVLVELKAVETVRPVHRAQVLSYLRATEIELGLLINFNVPVLKNGVRRLICSRLAGL
ncbi:MAG TPA: GxxExxY protein [Kofleriaceae bacterium]